MVLLSRKPTDDFRENPVITIIEHLIGKGGDIRMLIRIFNLKIFTEVMLVSLYRRCHI